MTRMTILNDILLVDDVSILGCAQECYSNWQVDIMFAGRLSLRFGVKIIQMVRTTLAQTLMQYHVSQFGH